MFRLKFYSSLFVFSLISLNVYGQSFNVINAIKNKVFPVKEIQLSPQGYKYKDSLDIAKNEYVNLIYGHDLDSILLVEKEYGKYIHLSESIIDEAKYLFYIGLKHQIRSQVDSAEYYFEKSLYLIPETYPGTHVHKYRIMALCELALIHHEHYHDPTQSLVYLNDAIQRCDEYFYPGFRQMTHAYLSSIYRYQGEFTKAVRISEEELEHNSFNRDWDSGGQDFLHYILIRELATSYQQCETCNQKDKAFELLKETLKFYKKVDDVAGQAEVLSDLAVYYSQYVSRDQEDDYMSQARTLAGQYQHKSVLDYVNYRYAQYLFNRSNYQESKSVLNQLLENSKVSNFYNRRNTLKLLSEVYVHIGLQKEALKSYKKSVVFDKLLGEKYHDWELSEMQTKTEIDNSEALVVLLQRRNSIIYGFWFLSVFLIILSLFLLGMTIYSRRKIAKQNIELQESNKAKNELFLILSHDLKGPISSFDNLGKRVYFLLQKKDYSGLQKFAEYFNTAGESLKHTVTSLLDWSLSQKDNFILEPEKINVYTEMSAIIEELNYILSDKEIDLDVIIDENSFIKCDRNSFQIIYRNLLHNAIKFSEIKGKVKVVVERKEMLNISIKNKISNRNIDGVERIRTWINNPEKGISMNMRTSGIGLYTASNLIHHNNGEISVTNEDQYLVIKTCFPRAT